MPNQTSSLFLLLCLVFSPLVISANTPQNPLLIGNSIYLSHQGVYKFNRSSLTLEWSKLQSVQTFEPVIADGLVFVGSSKGLYALNAVNGDIVWQIKGLRTLFSPSIDQYLYAGSRHGELYKIRPQDGAILWQLQFPGWIYSPAVFSKLGQLWTGGQSHQAYSVDIESGKLLKHIELDQESVFSPKQIDNFRVTYNLFSGNSPVIDARSALVIANLTGSSQPTHLDSDHQFIYRSQRDGHLTAFDKVNHSFAWRKKIVNRDLNLHPSSEGFLLLSDLGRRLVLFNLTEQQTVFNKQIDGSWFSPIQADNTEVIYFLKSSLQPNQLRAVRFYVQNK